MIDILIDKGREF